jgi:hypothetical protein
MFEIINSKFPLKLVTIKRKFGAYYEMASVCLLLGRKADAGGDIKFRRNLWRSENTRGARKFSLMLRSGKIFGIRIIKIKNLIKN